jgi:hypothetical protein
VKLNSEIEAAFSLEIVSENPIIVESEVADATEDDSQDDA